MKIRKLLAMSMACFVLSAAIPLGIFADEDFLDTDADVFIVEDDFFPEPIAEETGGETSGDTTENTDIPETQESTDNPFGDFTEPDQQQQQDDLIYDNAAEEGTDASEENTVFEDVVFDENLTIDSLVGAVTTTPAPTTTVTVTVTPTPLPSELVQVITLNDMDEESVAFSSASISDALLQAKAKDMNDITLRLQGDLVVDVPVVIDGELLVAIECGKDVIIKRGATSTGALFTISGKADVTISGGYVNEESHTLKIDGASTEATGPIFDVKGGSSLTLSDGVSIQNCNTTSAASVILVEKDAAALTLMGTTISNNKSSVKKEEEEDGTTTGAGAVYVEEGFTGDFNVGGDGAVVYISDNTDGDGEAANIYLEKAGDDAAYVTLMGDLPDGSDGSKQAKIGIKIKNEDNGVRVIKCSLDGIFENVYADSLKLFTYEGSETYSISTEEDQEGYLTNGSSFATPTPTPDPTNTPEPSITPGTSTSPTPTQDPSATATPTPTPTATATPATRPPYVPSVSSKEDGFKVVGLEGALEFPYGSNNTFDVTGASAETNHSDSLVVGDGKWSPYYWVMDGQSKQNNLPASDQLNNVFTTRTFNIKSQNGIYNTSASYKINLYFRLFTWAGSGWAVTDTVQYVQTSFTVAKITPTSAAVASSTPTATPSSGSNSSGTVSNNTSGTTTDYLAMTRAAQTQSAAQTQAALTQAAGGPGGANANANATGSVRTMDESPVGAMTMLAILSFMAAVFAVVKRRKGNVE